MDIKRQITSHSTIDGKLTERAYPLLLSGLDTLVVTYCLDTVAWSFKWDDLLYRRDAARQARKTLHEIELGSERFALQTHGRYPYAIILKNAHLEISLAERMQPCCQVRFLSEGLWTVGMDALEKRILTWLDSINALQTRSEGVSRADWAFDYALDTIDFDADSFVTRAAKDTTHRERGHAQTFTMGKGDIVLRLYDKVAEIEQQSGKSWFHQLWGQKEDVWRIEFQLRKERLKEGGIRTLNDLRDYQNDLLRELAQNHTTLRVPTTDSNRSRWPLHPLWRQLLADIDRLTQTGLVRSYDEEQALEYRLRKQCQAMYGNLKSIAAVEAMLSDPCEPITLEALIERLPDLLELEHSKHLWHADVERRMKAHGYREW